MQVVEGQRPHPAHLHCPHVIRPHCPEAGRAWADPLLDRRADLRTRSGLRTGPGFFTTSGADRDIGRVDPDRSGYVSGIGESDAYAIGADLPAETDGQRSGRRH